MFGVSVVCERTVKGYDEIKDKTHALTQGERLILILVDGITPWAEAERHGRRALESRVAESRRERLDRYGGCVSAKSGNRKADAAHDRKFSTARPTGSGRRHLA